MRAVRTGPLVVLALLGLLGRAPALAQAQAATVPRPAWSTLQVTHNWTQNQQPQLDQRHLVWQAWNGHDWEMVSEDLATGAVIHLTNDSLDQTDPHLVGDHVAWIEHAKLSTLSADRHYTFPDYSSTTLTLYDYCTGTATSVAGSDGIQDLQVGGDVVVWSAGQGTATEVYLHDLATGDTTRVTNDQVAQQLPQTDGRFVVFQTDQPGTRSEVSAPGARTT